MKLEKEAAGRKIGLMSMSGFNQRIRTSKRTMYQNLLQGMAYMTGGWLSKCKIHRATEERMGQTQIHQHEPALPPPSVQKGAS